MRLILKYYEAILLLHFQTQVKTSYTWQLRDSFCFTRFSRIVPRISQYAFMFSFQFGTICDGLISKERKGILSIFQATRQFTV